MKRSFSISLLFVAGLWNAVLPARAQVNVTQEHNNLSRDGLYVDLAFTPANAGNLARDLNFDGTRTPTLVVLAPRWWMCRVLRLRSWCSH